MNKTVAVVPARLCNDEGLKNKDILPFGKVNLLEILVERLLIYGWGNQRGGHTCPHNMLLPHHPTDIFNKITK